jgi:hypothetical protein
VTDATTSGAIAALSAALVAALGEVRARRAAEQARRERAEERRIRLALLAEQREDEVARLAHEWDVNRRQRERGRRRFR